MMSEQPTSRRQFLRQSAIATSAAALVCSPLDKQASVKAAEVDRSITVKTAPGVRQVDVLFDPANYTAFPHVVRLDGDELLMAFRQAPSQERVRHTHPRSVITVIRSYDRGETWDVENAGQLAAGGGQEFAPIYLGDGLVGGLLAMHEVVPVKEGERASIPHRHKNEYPYRNVGGFWCWSDNSGLTWPLHHNVLFAPKLQTCSTAIKLGAGTLLAPCYGNIEQGLTGVSSNVVYRSDDSGRTWSAPTVLARGTTNTRDYYEPVILEVEDGHLLAMHRVGRCKDGRHGLFWRNESRDGGKTWTEPAETNITSGACPRLLKVSDGRLLLTYGRRYVPYGLYARLSNDGGKSWSDTSWVLRAAPNSNQGYSSSIEIEPGRILTACYAQNSDGVTGITGTFWSLPSR
ncbi:MAG: exo-alpha-sialidase [Planctomycetes bacterium]|nr:exo-alpha-sialidase [Planctomycetota bacterium]MBL7038288.1 exo-alpha-sialidase [Pirellulaceae bacterium]